MPAVSFVYPAYFAYPRSMMGTEEFEELAAAKDGANERLMATRDIPESFILKVDVYLRMMRVMRGGLGSVTEQATATAAPIYTQSHAIAQQRSV